MLRLVGRQGAAMGSTDIGIFKLAEKRLAWAAGRQQVLAQNVANANTPGYVARDVAPFSAALAQAGGPPLNRTAPAHMEGAVPAMAARSVRPTERAPDGNAVSLEDQLTKVADTSGTQELAINIYRKYQGMFRTALGRGGM